MPNLQPQTLTNELLQRLSRFESGNEPSEFEAKLFLKEANKLKRVSPDEGWMLVGIVHSLRYDYEEAKSAFEKSLNHSPSNFDLVLSNYSIGLRRLGRFEESLEIVEKHVSDDNSFLLDYALLLSLKIGLYDKATLYSNKLSKFPSYENHYASYLIDLKTACDELNISEPDCSAIHILVSDAIYDKKIHSVDVSVRRDYEDNSLILAFQVNTDASTLSDIGLAVIDKLVESDIVPIMEHKVTPLILKGSS